MLAPGVAGQAERDRQPRPLLRTMVGDALRRTRLTQRRTLADVARAARVSMPYLSEVERGRKEASSEVVAAICEALHIDLSDLLAEVWRGLAELRERQVRRDRIIRLGVIGGVAAAQPADAPDLAVRPDSVADVPAPVGGPADAACLLAA
jgi:transcriptional regulator with XRE-family HTH domain